jgi:hypothetical protein
VPGAAERKLVAGNSFFAERQRRANGAGGVAAGGGFIAVGSDALLGSVSFFILFDYILNKRFVAHDIFTSFKSADFHVPIVEYIDLYSFANESDGNQNRIRTMPRKRVVILSDI